MLSDKKVVESAMSKIQGTSVHLSSANVTEENVQATSDTDSTSDDEQATVDESIYSSIGNQENVM